MSDAVPAIVKYLKENPQAGTIRSLLPDNGIIEAHAVTPAMLNSLDTWRRNSGKHDSAVLLLAIADGGETALSTHVEQSVNVFIFERSDDLTNLRQLRDELLQLFARPVILTIGGRKGLLQLRYDGRSGPRFDTDLGAVFENIRFTAFLETSKE